MCGIIAVIGRPADRTPPTIAEIAAELRAASDHLAPVLDRRLSPADLVQAVAEAAGHVERADAALRGTPGVRTLLGQPAGAAELAARVADLQSTIDELDAQLDADGRGLTPAELELLSTELVRVKDALWAIGRDRLRGAAAVGDLAGGPERPVPRSTPSGPCRSRSRRSTGSRSAVATPPGSTSSCATTHSTSPIRPSLA